LDLGLTRDQMKGDLVLHVGDWTEN
jgi:hypothetical protein